MPARDVTAPEGARPRFGLGGGRGWSRILAAAGLASGLAAVVLDRSGARSAAAQVWPAFVLVAGLLLVGLVADQDGIFAAAGRRLAELAPNPLALFAGAAAMVAVVTALLNLDTSVVFVTPVLVHAARRRGQTEVPLLVGCLLLSNAGSLLLPGSNLTNLIALGHFRLSGGQYLRHMALPWVVSVLITTGMIAILERRSMRPWHATTPRVESAPPEPVTFGLGASAVIAVSVLMVVLRAPALPVAGVGIVVVTVRLWSRQVTVDKVGSIVGLPVLVGLFGVATALGTLGRAWSGPATLLSHLDSVETAAVAAGVSVLVNNLPAASILAARVPAHPFALLVGLDIGPNLFATGSLAWILWWRTARASGSDPPVGRAIVLGLVTVPLAMAGALAMLAVTGSQ